MVGEYNMANIIAGQRRNHAIGILRVNKDKKLVKLMLEGPVIL